MKSSHSSRALFLFIISFLLVVPAVACCVMADDSPLLFKKPYLPGLPTVSVPVKNTAGVDPVDTVPFSTADNDDTPDPTTVTAEATQSSDTSDSSEPTSHPDIVQTTVSHATDSIEEKIQYYETALSSSAATVCSQPTLALKCSDGVTAGSTFKVSISSAGEPVNATIVSFMAQAVYTDGTGVVYLQAPSVPEDIKIPVTISKEGYSKYTTYVRVIPVPSQIESEVPSVPEVTDDLPHFTPSMPQLFFQRLFPWPPVLSLSS